MLREKRSQEQPRVEYSALPVMEAAAPAVSRCNSFIFADDPAQEEPEQEHDEKEEKS